jgi:catechol 2,3-dioxygenase-like lactoylglutathione lyase family enzyme
MIAHISIGVSDIGKSKRFYDAALEPLGYRCVRAARAATGYGYGAETRLLDRWGSAGARGTFLQIEQI